MGREWLIVSPFTFDYALPDFPTLGLSMVAVFYKHHHHSLFQTNQIKLCW